MFKFTFGQDPPPAIKEDLSQGGSGGQQRPMYLYPGIQQRQVMGIQGAGGAQQSPMYLYPGIQQHQVMGIQGAGGGQQRPMYLYPGTLTVIPDACNKKRKRLGTVVDIVDPRTGSNISKDIYDQDIARSSGSSNNPASLYSQTHMIHIDNITAGFGKATITDSKSSSPVRTNRSEALALQNNTQTRSDRETRTTSIQSTLIVQNLSDQSLVTVDKGNVPLSVSTQKPKNLKLSESNMYSEVEVKKHDKEIICKNDQPNEISPTKPLLIERKVYDRDFLIKLRSDPKSRTKPLNLPNLDIILKDTSSKKNIQSKSLVEKSTQKIKLRASNTSTLNDKPSSIAITKEVEKENVLRTKYEPVEGAECSLVKKHQESSVDTSKLEDEIVIFLDKNSCFNCLRGQLNMRQIHMRLLCIMSDDKENSVENICKWISANVGQRASEPRFIKILTTAILEACIEPHNNTWKLREDRFRNLRILIPRYISVNVELLELQCLIAIQEYIHNLENPLGMLMLIFENLWIDNIISTNAFCAWESNKDPTALTGKSAAMMDLTPFFDFLEAIGFKIIN